MVKRIHCDDCGTTEEVFAVTLEVRRVGKSTRLRRRRVGDFCLTCCLKRYPSLTRASMTRASKKMASTS